MISMRGVTVCQEMERGKRKRESGTRFIWICARGERERARERAEFQPGLGRVGGFLCALFRAEVLTEGP